MTCDKTNSPLALAGNPAVIAHMNQLQSIINRLATSSASCKTWCLGLVTATIGLAGVTHAPAVVGFALVPITIFGYLDTCYLAQERAYRQHFERHAEDIRQLRYELKNVFDVRVKSGVPSAILAFTSWSIWPVYIGLATVFFVARHQGYLQLIAGRT